MHITGMKLVGRCIAPEPRCSGRYEQANQDVVTSTSPTSARSAGTQVSALGIHMLRLLQTKIDYRDGLVDFIFDPKHLPKQIKLNKQ